jgi:hypothetical protein
LEGNNQLEATSKGGETMDFKSLLARHTTKPSDFARAYTFRLVELAEHLTASLIAFSGKRAVLSETQKASKIVFENHFEMEMADFVPFDETVTGLTAPNIEQIKTTLDADLLNNIFRNLTAFLCLYSENAAHKYMKPENAMLFSSVLYYSVAERSAGRFGLSSDPGQVAKTINELLPSFHCERLLNMQSFGKDDGFGLLIKHISFSQDGSTQYGFVVGSRKQSFGCATAMLEVVLEIDDSLKRCVKVLQW